MEFIFMLAFVGWLYALLAMSPAAPRYKEKDVSLDLSFAEEEEKPYEFPRAA